MISFAQYYTDALHCSSFIETYILLFYQIQEIKKQEKISYALEQQMERKFPSRKEGWTSGYNLLFHPATNFAILLDHISRPCLLVGGLMLTSVVKKDCDCS